MWFEKWSIDVQKVENHCGKDASQTIERTWQVNHLNFTAVLAYFIKRGAIPINPAVFKLGLTREHFSTVNKDLFLFSSYYFFVNLPRSFPKWVVFIFLS